MQRHRLELIEVLDEALRLLPPTVPAFTKVNVYEPILNLRRESRVDAKGLQTRRSRPNRKWENWVDVQTITLQEEAD
jgi:hypothetical protein